MSHYKQFILRRILLEEQGQIGPWFALCICMMFLGMGAFVVDVGHGYFCYQELQAATDAAALAGAQQIYTSNAISTATAYSGTTGVSNAPNSYFNLNSVSMAPGYPELKCLNTVKNMGILCEGPNTANAIIVKEQALIPTFFARVFGINQMTLSTTSTASIGAAVPLNVAIVVDTTLSEDTPDNNCGSSVTEIGCEMGGAQQLMAGLSPYVDHIALFAFPNVNPSTAGNDVSCSPPQSLSPGFGGQGNVGSLATALPYTFPTIPTTASTGYTYASGSGTYEIIGFTENYGSNYNSSNNTNSYSGTTPPNNLTGAVGTSNSGSSGPCLAPPNNDGMYGTYLPGVIYAAQASLAAQMSSELATLPAASPQPQNIMIILSDGDSNASMQYQGVNNEFFLPNTYNESGLYPSDVGDCGQEVVAASVAKAAGTQIFTVAYGSPNTSVWNSNSINNSYCPTDTDGFFQTEHLGSNVSSYPNISPCQAMQDMASPNTSKITYFFSDPNQEGGSSDCNAPAGQPTSLVDIFAAIAGSLTNSRLLPNGTT
jgi:Putative Flp pilus-assembly TadE/G-like